MSIGLVSSRELSFKKGDTVYILRKIDQNWYEGEHYGRVGIFPISYVEVRPFSSSPEGCCSKGYHKFQNQLKLFSIIETNTSRKSTACQTTTPSPAWRDWRSHSQIQLQCRHKRGTLPAKGNLDVFFTGVFSQTVQF